MFSSPRSCPFVIVSSNHGTMIVNRNDYRDLGENRGYGIGWQLFRNSVFDPTEVETALRMLKYRKQNFGQGVVALDCGANIGVHTVEWGKLMYGWGTVLSFEAQEKIYYALAGNVAINNCLNVTARHCAVGACCETIEVPEPDYTIPSSYGSLELQKSEKNEFIGQNIDYENTKSIAQISIDSLELKRLDFIKIDVEGMEESVLEGARKSIKEHMPIMLIEIAKSDRSWVETFLKQYNYAYYDLGKNYLVVHKTDPLESQITFDNKVLTISKG